MYKRIIVALFIGLLFLGGTTTVRADEPDLGYTWNNHASPFSFKFNNLIDNHQQTRLLNNGRLQGYIYVQFTGEMINGIPVARRANCDDPTLDCRVGWEVTGVPVSDAMLVQKGPRLWDIPVANLPSDPEFVHFHWTNDNQGHNPKKPCGLVVYSEDNPVTYDGYLFKRTAMATFYWLGGNDDKEAGRLVTSVLDLHSNIFGWWTGGGGHGGEEPGGEPGGEEGCGGHDTGDDTGCSGGGMGGETGGDTGGCGDHETGDDTGCSGGGMGGETGGDTGGCGDHETGGDTGCTGGDMGGETGGCGGS